jgi:hypothetical protein
VLVLWIWNQRRKLRLRRASPTAGAVAAP